MRTISTFSGVGGLDLGLHRAGFQHVAFCEADPFRRKVLARHWPGVPIHDDVRTFEYEGQVDCLVGGFPCQDLSVAGKRAGLEGERSGLFYDFARIADRVVRPGGVLIAENVAGMLNSNEGRDFAIVLRTLSDLGFSVGYRTLDSRYFRVPQRRRRVFIVGIRAVTDSPSEILALLEGSGGNPSQGGEAGQADPGGVGQGAEGRGGGTPRAIAFQTAHTGANGSNISESDDAFTLDKASRQAAYVAEEAGTLTKGYGASSGQDLDGGAGLIANAITKHVATGPDENSAQAHHLVPTTDGEPDVSPPVTKKWATGSGGPAGDETQNLTYSPEVAGTITRRQAKGTNSTLDDGALIVEAKAVGMNQRDEVRESEDDASFALSKPSGRPGHGSPVVRITTAAEDEGEAVSWDSLNHAASDVAPTLGQNTGMATGRAGVVLPPEETDEDPNVANPTAFHPTQTPISSDQHSPALGKNTPGMGIHAPTITKYNMDSRSPQSEEQQRVVGAVHGASSAVRRLTPVECERLQGWPDGWTLPDGPSC